MALGLNYQESSEKGSWPMITYRELGRQARVFKSLTGVTVAEFGELYEKVQPIWFANEIKRLSRHERKRAIGGGRDYALKLKERLT